MEKNFDFFNQKPKSLKVLQGTYRKDREEKNIIITKELTEIPKPFTWICNSGKKMFRAIIKDLKDTGILTEIDLYALNAACHEYGKYMDYEKLLKKEGIEREVQRTTAKGEIFTVSEQRPEVKLSEKALKAAHEQFKVFGLNPLDRSKLHIPTSEKDNDGAKGFRRDRSKTA